MQGTVAGYSLRYWLTLITGLLECLLFAGLVFGHASLVFVLKKEEYFGWLCVDTNSTMDSKGEHLLSLDWTRRSFRTPQKQVSDIFVRVCFCLFFFQTVVVRMSSSRWFLLWPPSSTTSSLY